MTDILTGLIGEEKEPVPHRPRKDLNQFELRNDPHYIKQQGMLRGILADIPGGFVDIAALGLDYVAQGVESLLPKSASNLLGIPEFRESMKEPVFGSAHIEKTLEGVGVLGPSTNTGEEFMYRLAGGFLDGTPGAAGTTRHVTRGPNVTQADIKSGLLHSPLEEGLKNLKDTKARPPAAWKKVLMKTPVGGTAREMSWIKLDDYLDALPPNQNVTIDEISNFIETNRLDIRERRKYLPGVKLPEEVQEEIRDVAYTKAMEGIDEDLAAWMERNRIEPHMLAEELRAGQKVDDLGGISTITGGEIDGEAGDVLIDIRDPEDKRNLEEIIQEASQHDPLPSLGAGHGPWSPADVVNLLADEIFPKYNQSIQKAIEPYNVPGWAIKPGDYRYVGEFEDVVDINDPNYVPDDTYRDFTLWMPRKEMERINIENPGVENVEFMGNRETIPPIQSSQYSDLIGEDFGGGGKIKQVHRYTMSGEQGAMIEIGELDDGTFHVQVFNFDEVVDTLDEAEDIALGHFIGNEFSDAILPEDSDFQLIARSEAEEFFNEYFGSNAKYAVLEWDPVSKEYVYNPNQMPGPTAKKALRQFYVMKDQTGNPQEWNAPQALKNTFDEGNRNIVEYDPNSSVGGHHGEDNILAHGRYAFTTLEDGTRALVINEAQSDWGQKGAKEGWKMHPLDEKKYMDVLDNTDLVFVQQYGDESITGPKGEQGFWTTRAELDRFEKDLESAQAAFNLDNTGSIDAYEFLPEGYVLNHHGESGNINITRPDGTEIPEVYDTETSAIARAWAEDFTYSDDPQGIPYMQWFDLDDLTYTENSPHDYELTEQVWDILERSGKIPGDWQRNQFPVGQHFLMRMDANGKPIDVLGASRLGRSPFEDALHNMDESKQRAMDWQRQLHGHYNITPATGQPGLWGIADRNGEASMSFNIHDLERDDQYLEDIVEMIQGNMSEASWRDSNIDLILEEIKDGITKVDDHNQTFPGFATNKKRKIQEELDGAPDAGYISKNNPDEMDQEVYEYAEMLDFFDWKVSQDLGLGPNGEIIDQQKFDDNKAEAIEQFSPWIWRETEDDMIHFDEWTPEEQMNVSAEQIIDGFQGALDDYNDSPFDEMIERMAPWDEDAIKGHLQNIRFPSESMTLPTNAEEVERFLLDNPRFAYEFTRAIDPDAANLYEMVPRDLGGGGINNRWRQPFPDSEYDYSDPELNRIIINQYQAERTLTLLENANEDAPNMVWEAILNANWFDNIMPNYEAGEIQRLVEQDNVNYTKNMAGESPSEVRPVERINPKDYPKEVQDAIKGLNVKRGRHHKGPFVADTGDWTNLLSKRYIQIATEGGADAIIMTTGKQQHDRWGGFPLERAEYTYDKEMKSKFEKMTKRYGGDPAVAELMTFPGPDGKNKGLRGDFYSQATKKKHGDFMYRFDIPESLKEQAKKSLPYLVLPAIGAGAQREKNNGLIME